MSGKKFLIIVVITFLTIAAWVTFDILHTRAQIKLSPETEKLIAPVNPNLDIEVLNR